MNKSKRNNLIAEIEKLEEVLHELILKKEKSFEEEDRIENLQIAIEELSKTVYFNNPREQRIY